MGGGGEGTGNLEGGGRGDEKSYPRDRGGEEGARRGRTPPGVCGGGRVGTGWGGVRDKKKTGETGRLRYL